MQHLFLCTNGLRMSGTSFSIIKNETFRSRSMNVYPVNERCKLYLSERGLKISTNHMALLLSPRQFRSHPHFPPRFLADRYFLIIVVFQPYLVTLRLACFVKVCYCRCYKKFLDIRSLSYSRSNQWTGFYMIMTSGVIMLLFEIAINSHIMKIFDAFISSFDVIN